MHRSSRAAALPGLLCLLALSLLLSGCSAANTAGQVPDAGKDLATKAPDVAREAATQAAEPTPQELTERPSEEPGESEGSGDRATVESPLGNLRMLGSVHVNSSYWAKKAGRVTSEGALEGDVDANGNQHMVLTGDAETEVYVVDGTLYMKTEGDARFVAMEGLAEDAPFLYLMNYGGLYALGVGTEGADNAGSEAVNGFQCEKYQLSWDTLGIAAPAGADLQGYAWIDTGSRALVKSQLDWTIPAHDGQPEQAYHSEFSATRAAVAAITAPADVAIDALLGLRATLENLVGTWDLAGCEGTALSGYAQIEFMDDGAIWLDGEQAGYCEVNEDSTVEAHIGGGVWTITDAGTGAILLQSDGQMCTAVSAG